MRKMIEPMKAVPDDCHGLKIAFMTWAVVMQLNQIAHAVFLTLFKRRRKKDTAKF